MPALPFNADPAEDDGAATADRYLFQYCCAAARLLAALARGYECELVCEWHEDYLVVRDGHAEAVSVKHREDHRPAWSIATLAGDDGNLQHLLETFHRGEGVECCFETNRAHKAADLWSAAASARSTARDDLTSRLNATRAEVDAFLDHLVITRPPVPGRQYIVSTYASTLAAPALDRLGLAALSPTRAMEIAWTLVADASRDRILEEAWGALLAAAPPDRAAILAEHRVEARRVTSEQLREALQEAERFHVPRLETIPGEAPPETTMTRKLQQGGLGPSVIDTARRRRRLWYSHRAEYRDLGDREAELRSLQEWVQDQANAAENHAIGGGGTYGPLMYDELMARLRASDLLPAGIRLEDRDPALLSGAVFELTDECSVWWSPRFELENGNDDA